MSKTKEFIEKAKNVHGDKYNYSHVCYLTRETEVDIICPIHGSFKQKPFVHLRGSKCPKCVGKHKRSNTEFVNEAKIVHGNKYEYKDISLTKMKDKVKIICPIHGNFEQRASDHLNGQGCPKCKFEKLSNLNKHKTEDFIKLASLKHNGFYNYSRVVYINSKTKVNITCPIHGQFEQKPFVHLDGSGCKKCKGRLSTNTKEFVDLAAKIHGEKYDYSSSIYTSSKSLVSIICPIHGVFKQIPNAHLNGTGCPKCNLFGTIAENKLYQDIKKFFGEEVVQTYKCKWLGKQHLDIYIPSLKVAIEYQGGQHFIPIKFFGGEEGLEKVKKRDEKKRKLCIKNNIKLYYFTNEIRYVPENYQYVVFKDIQTLIDSIINGVHFVKVF